MGQMEQMEQMRRVGLMGWMGWMGWMSWMVSMLTLIVLVVMSGCDDGRGDPTDPDNLDERLSDIGSPVDTLTCPLGRELIYSYRGVRVYDDMLVRELDALLDLVISNLLPSEEILFADIRYGASCRRLIYSTDSEIIVQTCRQRDELDHCLGGRYFGFLRVEGAVHLLEIGEWAPPG